MEFASGALLDSIILLFFSEIMFILLPLLISSLFSHFINLNSSFNLSSLLLE